MNFKICGDVSKLGIKVAFLVINDIESHFYDDPFRSTIEKFYTQFANSNTQDTIDNDTNIVGYRKLHTEIGITDNSLAASPESLIKILFKHKTLRPINFIVDTYNYISIKNRISIGAHDLEHINGDVRLCFTKGDELFIPLGNNKPKKVTAGEYCYIDDENEILCRLDCRQCDKTKTSENTKSCLFILQGHEDISIDLIDSTANELQNIFNSFSTKTIL